MNSRIYAHDSWSYTGAEIYLFDEYSEDEGDFSEIQESSIIEEKTRPKIGYVELRNSIVHHAELPTVESSVSLDKNIDNSRTTKIVKNLRMLRDLSLVFAFGGMFIFSLAITRGQYEMASVGVFAAVGFSMFFTHSKSVIGTVKALAPE